MELLNAKHPGIPPTLRDDRLKDEVGWSCCVVFIYKCFVYQSSVFLSKAEQLKQHYMAKVNSEVSEAHQNLQPVLQHIKELKRKVTVHRSYSLVLFPLNVVCNCKNCSLGEPSLPLVAGRRTADHTALHRRWPREPDPEWAHVQL